MHMYILVLCFVYTPATRIYTYRHTLSLLASLPICSSSTRSRAPAPGDNSSEPINTTYFHDGPASGKPPCAETAAPFQLSIVFEYTFDSDQPDTHPHQIGRAHV